MDPSAPDSHHKALRINLDPSTYGTLAEIGAGQEVARWFFRVGGAAGTIAKAMSAYDMVFSDSIYGVCERYVSRQRLQTMLDHEYQLLVERLGGRRGSFSRFFVFADTVATRSYIRQEDGHGWLGVRFQVAPGGPASEVTLHARFGDRETEQQQEAVGILGVNLAYGAIYHHADPDGLISSLQDGLNTGRVEVDMIEFTGPAFAGVDNRLMSLKLVQHGLTHAAMFTADGAVAQPSEVLYKRPTLVQRGSFRPATRTAVDMQRCALAQFVREPSVAPRAGEVVSLFEMTLKNLQDDTESIDAQDFLERADILATLGNTVLVSNLGQYHRLAAWLARHTNQTIGLVMGVPTLKEVFDERYYTDLSGGILESFGRLFKNDLKLYAYPMLEGDTLTTAANLRVAPHLHHLYTHLIENHLIKSLPDVDPTCLPIYSRDVLARIRAGDASWMGMTPPAVAELIQSRGLMGFR